ncbi:MAG TPA: outer membrane beta-barrel protein [Gammaproteobacteria bacterium]
MNNNKVLLPLLAAASLLCVTAPSFAGPYIGAGLGYFRIDSQDFLDEDNDLRDDHATWKAFAGANVNDFFGLEVSHIEFGESEDGPFELEAQGQTIAATLGFPVGDDSSIYFKAGQLYWDMDASIAGEVIVDDNGNDNFVGVGMRVGGQPGLGLKLEYESFDIGDAEIDMPSISLNMAF